MKKILILTAGLLMTAAAFTGCKKDDEVALNVQNAPATALVGAEGTTATFDVVSNKSWTITSDAAWVTVSPNKGNGNAKITVTAAANTSPGTRQAVLTVKTDDNLNERKVKISQNSGDVIEIGDGSKSGYKITANRTLTADKTYLIKGFVYVASGATLTIEPGTIIKGQESTRGTLIIEKGGKIQAAGTAQKPIVFTSEKPKGQRAPGDWGGLILLGNARNNKGSMTIEGGIDSTHGGSNDADNSGTLQYVRIEFAGIEYGPDNEINGLTLGSVGSGTTIDHVQVSHSGDDSFEWFGGAVNAKYLIAYKGWDDDFDADNGFSGNVQFGLIVRDPEVADKSASNGFESDNNSDGSADEPFTSAVFANISSFGPVTDPAIYVDRGSVHGSPESGVFQAGIQLRRNTKLNVFNSVIAGWPIGLIIENDKGTAQAWATDNSLRVNNVMLAGMQRNFQDKAKNAAKPVVDPALSESFVSTYFSNATQREKNRTSHSIAELKVSAAPIAIPAADSPLVAADAASWTDGYVSGPFFTKTPYIGAFGPTETATNNWAGGWTNFDPQNTDY
jgi:hypothetical protein